MSIQKKVKITLCAWLVFAAMTCGLLPVAESAPAYTVTTNLVADSLSLASGYAWVQPRSTAIEPGAASRKQLMTVVKRTVTGTDAMFGIGFMTSADDGATWSALTELPYARRMMPNGYMGIMASAVPVYHPPSGKVIVFGNIVCYNSSGVIAGTRYPAYTVYDPVTDTWAPDYTVITAYENYNPTGAYPFVKPDGTILWPMMLGGVQIATATFDGTALSITNMGPVVANSGTGGEAHLTYYGGQYYLAIRDTTTANRIAASSDGVNFASAVNVKWEDGTSVQSVDTQMRWVTHSGGLFLVYTRVDSSNTGIFRNRAPLWMSELNTSTLRLVKSSEHIVMPISPGKDDLGNFGAAAASRDTSLITSAEWQRTSTSKNRIYVTRIAWSAPNNTVPIVVDNTDPGFSANAPWVASTIVAGYLGANYVTDGTSGADTSARWAAWTPTLTTAGNYRIYMRWTTATNRPDAAPLRIVHDGGTDTSVTVNQQTNNGKWVLLGTYSLTPASAPNVKILATDNGYTVADAVKFELAP
ncbi:hypothetical protein [Paenibacillus thalictri]|uniref:Golvesin/Xly CBD-like domain-containing protein n=1 Tax=Paenibacillus thalictri TaxID=2527873 RepID=A0A4Q9DJ06_9BACL|nr:hypothetical protein [Paenibacillus thalictri]TBL73329.1 hypothetical protein EYB31_27005 [Paenibacillus thalictri]